MIPPVPLPPRIWRYQYTESVETWVTEVRHNPQDHTASGGPSSVWGAESRRPSYYIRVLQSWYY